MTLNEKLDLIKQARDDIKTSLADKGQDVNTDIRTYAEAIDSISTGVDTSDATASADDIISPKTAYVNGEKLLGNIALIEKIPHGSKVYQSKTIKTGFSSISLYDSYIINNVAMFVYISNNNLNCIVLKDNTVIAEQSFTVSSAFTFTTIQAIALNLVSSSTTQLIFEVGVTYRNGSTYNYSFNTLTINLENNSLTLGTKVSTYFNGASGSNSTLWAVKTIKGRFISIIKYNADDYFLYVTTNWSNNTATASYTGIYHGYSYNPSANMTGNYKWLIQPDFVQYINPSAALLTNYNNSARTKAVYISPSNKYMFMNNVLYKISPSTNYTSMYNSKVPFASITASEVYFTDDEEYIYTKATSGIDIYKLTSNSIVPIQSMPYTNYAILASNSGTSFFILDAVNAKLILCYMNNSELTLEGLIRQGQNFIRLTGLDVPDASNVLENIEYKNQDGDYIIGTMPNNGELTYTPSTEEQTIPAGYTSGGKVNPMDATTSTIYKQAIAILKDIKPTASAIYKQIDYIGGTGSQKLYTSIQTNSATDTYEVVLRDTAISSWEYYFQLGVMKLARYGGSSTAFCMWAGTKRISESFTLGNLNDGNYHTIKITPNAISFDGVQKATYTIGGTPTGTINFFYYPSNVAPAFLLKEFKMYRNGELISHLIPYKNIQTNIVGMYDLIGNKFYNNTGSGTFTNGDIIGDIDMEDYTLTQRLLELQDYINQNIIPVNIRADKTIFDITGTAPVTFSTVEEMNEHTDLAEDTFAIVYGTSYVGTYRLDNGTWTQIGDSTEEQQIMDVLNDVVASTEQYEGTGGTDEEINEVFDSIIGGNV